ncbi:general secretion pathway protein GspK [Vibrio sinensis]|uniref:General secretion pathway protein GspK n=1 Tax=Vibrio sinensis TaxID=2302434 RepID=A0A3A6QTY9_9VIBR|nr:type II secretion system minor pseudopilin GspK [Vibrio sinensis]RJX72437.1 general secretion pathway protein GspK [Vibrio sinensis]
MTNSVHLKHATGQSSVRKIEQERKTGQKLKRGQRRNYARPKHSARQTGVALIVVLMLLAIMATIAATMSERLFSQFKRTENQLNYQQAYWYSVGVESLAKVGIEQSFKDSDNINLSQPWALEEQTYPLENATLVGRLVDKQACFNLNALASAEASTTTDKTPYLVETLQVLLEEQGVENYQAEIAAQSLWEFVDNNGAINSTVGVEDSTYESLKPAYMTANSLLADSSELRSVYQVSAQVMEKVHPFVCALPTTEFRLNVNTISVDNAALLAAMFHPALAESDAKKILEDRPFDGWDNVDDFLSEPALASVKEQQKKQVKGYLTVDSAYFELDATIEVDHSRVRVRSLLFSDDRETATVIRRRFGGIGERVFDRSAEQK